MFDALLQALVSGLAVGGAYALVALGFSITFTTTKTLNFSHGEFVSAGAFIGMSVLFLALGKPFDATSFGGDVPGAAGQGVALLAAVTVMGGLGWLLYVLGVRPFAGRPGMAWVMSTLGFGVILQSIGLALWGPKPVVVPGPGGDDVLRFGDIGVRPQELLSLVVAVITEGRKDVSSRDGMGISRRTSPYYEAWVEKSPLIAARIPFAWLAFYDGGHAFLYQSAAKFGATVNLFLAK